VLPFQIRSFYGDLPEDFDPHLSRSLKVTGTDMDRSATYDFLLVFHSNYGPISYRFRYKGQYLQKFPTAVHLPPPRMGLLLELQEPYRGYKIPRGIL